MSFNLSSKFCAYNKVVQLENSEMQCYAPIIENVAELKNIIAKNFGDNAYEWFAKKTLIESLIEKLANQKYEKEYREKAKVKIKELSPESAKRILEKWIEDKPLIGIDILKD